MLRHAQSLPPLQHDTRKYTRELTGQQGMLKAGGAGNKLMVFAISVHSKF